MKQHSFLRLHPPLPLPPSPGAYSACTNRSMQQRSHLHFHPPQRSAAQHPSPAPIAACSSAASYDCTRSSMQQRNSFARTHRNIHAHTGFAPGVFWSGLARGCRAGVMGLAGPRLPCPPSARPASRDSLRRCHFCVLSSRELAPYGFDLQCLSCSCPACYLRLKPQWCLHGGISAERDQQFCVDGAMVGAVAV